SPPRRTRTHYVTWGSQRMQKHNFGVTCPGALLVGPAPGPPEHEKCCVLVSRPGRTRTHYVTWGSQRMQKHKVGVTCPGALLVGPATGPPEHETYYASMS